ncbi:MAG TPA: alpha/beta hydrolase [Chitinophagaceae bacterium]|nr:alpha/beta hydrolase [Chitinophagaceae bacterium]
MHSAFLEDDGARIHYLAFGQGPLPAICLHGYGEQADSFLFLEKDLGNQYTFYAPDLPFHGRTAWPEDQYLTPSRLAGWVMQLLGSGGPPVTLIGFSLGGRMALALYEVLGARVDRLVLLAPDGLKVNVWYRLATHHALGRKIFELTMRHPGWFFILMEGLQRLGLVNASLYKFARHYVADASARRLLFLRWTSLHPVRPHLPRIRNAIASHHTTCYLLYGIHDRIITPARGKRLCQGIESSCRLVMLHAGHQLLHEKHLGEILPALQDPAQ